jgi:uncharacterized protein with PIN domain
MKTAASMLQIRNRRVVELVATRRGAKTGAVLRALENELARSGSRGRCDGLSPGGARQANGDCFAYAQAKSARAALLFKGEDFSRTDAETAA